LRVQEIILENNSRRYLLVDSNGLPVLPVMRYLKFLDTTGKSSNTQKTYCYALKQYFMFLKQMDLDHTIIKLNHLVDFVGWLRNPLEGGTVTSLHPIVSRKTESTINLTLTAVMGFYDYLYRNEEMDKAMEDLLVKQVFTGGRKYKDFLYHINKGKPSNRNILKLKKKRRKVKVLRKEQVEQLIQATNNIRDRLLILVLFETGLRIGELLSLFLEDFISDHKNGHRIRLVDRGELENGAKLKTGEREIFVSRELMDLFDDYLYEVVDELDIHTNFVFVKMRGSKIGRAMNYQDASSLFNRLSKKTGINVHPHLLRHTHATMFYKQTGDIKQVQERLGHSLIQTTMDLYLHPSSEDIRESWEKVQHAFNINIKGKPGE